MEIDFFVEQIEGVLTPDLPTYQQHGPYSDRGEKANAGCQCDRQWYTPPAPYCDTFIADI